MKSHLVRILGVALLAGVVATTAFAGGSNYTYDPENKIPYAWNPQNWVGGAVPVFTDLGNLKNSNPLITNERADALVVSGWAQWNAVPTLTMRAQVLGDFSVIGLPEINRTNAGLIFGQWNGGGIHVIYDTDGKILNNYLGSTAPSGFRASITSPRRPTSSSRHGRS